MKTTRAIVLVAMLGGAVGGAIGCDEGETDPCPQIKAGGGKVVPVLNTGTAPTASGGTLTAGVYNLSKLDVVLSASPSPEGRLSCERLTEATVQDTWRITPSSATQGSLVSLAVGDDGNGIITERRSQGTYASAGTALTIAVSGNVCETMLIPQADGGIGQTRTVDDQASAPLSRSYTSTESTLLFFVRVETGGATDCDIVYTYDKE